MQKQRRDFLKIAAAGAAGLALARRANRAFAAWPSTGTLAVNPTIDNMRVVACYDPQMMKSLADSKLAATFQNEQTLVDSCQVQANMDAMAMQLAQQTTADAAWKAIFRTGKSSWAATKVAIKVNCIATSNMASLAVVQKFCNIFAGFGVLPANIIIYDGNTTYGAGISNYTPYFSATDTTKTPGVVSSYNTALGGTTNAAIPGGTSAACTADIANGTIDILVNIANNKGHNQAWTGGATLSMKNHFGTFPPTHDINFLFNINKSDAILGGTPVRQQLCFIDSLLANSKSNTGNPTDQPNYLIMGVFGPAVDYLTVKKVREAVMGATHTETTINSYITTFGYTTTDPVWILAPAASSAACGGGGTGGAGGSSGAGGAGSGGTSAAGGARSGGTSAAGGAGNGGQSGSGGVASGGANGSGGARSGGTSGAAGAGGGGTSGPAGAGGGGTSGVGGKGGGGTSGAAGAGGGGTSSAGGKGGGGTTGVAGAGGGGASGTTGMSTGGTTGNSSATFAGGGAGGKGGVATSAPLASGGSFATGGISAGAGTTVSSMGGSTGTTEAESAAVAAGKAGGGCNVASGGRKATGWGAILALGAVVAEKLRRLVNDDDRSP